jgi:hypothetical protein
MRMEHWQGFHFTERNCSSFRGSRLREFIYAWYFCSSYPSIPLLVASEDTSSTKYVVLRICGLMMKKIYIKLHKMQIFKTCRIFNLDRIRQWY